MTKPRVNTNPVANGYTGPNERIIEYSSLAGGGLIGFQVTDAGRLLVDVYRHDATVDVRVGRPDGMPAPTAKVFRMLDLSNSHLPRPVFDDLSSFAGVIADEREHGWLLFVPEDIDGHLSEYSRVELIAELESTMAPPHDPNYRDVHYGQAEELQLLEDAQIPESVIAIWRYAQANDCDYVLLDRDAERDPALPTYDW